MKKKPKKKVYLQIVSAYDWDLGKICFDKKEKGFPKKTKDTCPT